MLTDGTSSSPTCQNKKQKTGDDNTSGERSLDDGIANFVYSEFNSRLILRLNPTVIPSPQSRRANPFP